MFGERSAGLSAARTSEISITRPARIIGGFRAFGRSYFGGVNVALADTDDDGTVETVAAMSHGDPEDTAFAANTYAKGEDFIAFDLSFLGGINVG
ncbi:MAG: hypothetical protein K1X57_13535 [Gemmataceae bacterium]|nr:hypothetical protein [Gemmataceae bacterium]